MFLFPFLAGCQAGGNVSNSLNQPQAPIHVAVPTIAIPSDTTYYGNSSTLTISGLCQDKSIVDLTGAAFDRTICSGSTFTFTVNKTIDGMYPFMITQSVEGVGTSQAAILFWVLKTSVTSPSISSPSTNPFLSGLDTLTITGGCESGATVQLTGDGSSSTKCSASTYTLTDIKVADGTYNFGVRQTDLAGNSASTPLQWKKEILSAAPMNPQVVVGRTQVFNFVGGSGSYTATLTANPSNGTFNLATKTYTAGPIAGVIDILEVEDSLHTKVQIQIETVADAADHIDIPADGGDLQIKPVGRNLDNPLKVFVADQYGNAVKNFQVTFSLANGDAKFLDKPVQRTNNNGVAQINLKMGFASVKNAISVRPTLGTLPDAAGTGRPTVTMFAYSSTSNAGDLGAAFATTVNPSRTLAIDIDKDGIMDMVVLNGGDPSLGVFKGRGGALFLPMTKIQPICPGPSGLTMGDFNTDTYPDLIVTCPGSDKYTSILSLGNGSYAAPVSTAVDPSETLPVNTISGDFNNDGKADLAFVSAGASVVSVRFGNGDGTFGLPAFYPIGLGPIDLVSADFDKDGYLDIAVLNAAENTIGFLVNNGNGTFAAQYTFSTGNAPASLTVGDFDKDGYPDIAIVNNSDNNVSVLMNDQTGSWLSGVPIDVGYNPTSITTGDLNADTKPDLAVTNADDNTLSVLTGNGDGTFTVTSTLSILNNPVFINAADLNGDGKSDVAISSNGDQKIEVLVSQGNGQLGLVHTTDPNPSAVRLADLDEDGYQDLLITSRSANSLEILKGNGLGFWTHWQTLSTANGPTAILVDDFNLDGHPDIAVAHQNIAAVRVFLNAGAGDFSGTPANYTVGLNATALIARDLDHDGYPEIIAANSGSNSISILPNAGDGTYQNRINYSTGSQPVAVAAADLNSDGELDLVTVNQSAGSISVLVSSGGLTYQAQVEYAVGSGPTSIVLDYFNSDGNVDVAVSNELEGSVGVLLGAGDGSFSPVSPFWSNLTPKGMLTADFNGDGRQDFLAINGTLQAMTLLFGSGTGQFNLTKNIPAFHSSEIAEIGDINNDGAVDIVTIDPNQGRVRTYMGH